MLKILTVIGARPQIIKSAAINRVVREKFSAQVEEIIIHTGQHYDENMSQTFFDELNIAKPHRNLGIQSSKHNQQIAEMIEGISQCISDCKPNCLLIYGDTNSTLAGALAASKIGLPVVHVEAGLRSFNKNMPEEINRVLTDHISTMLFSPTQKGIENLMNENINHHDVEKNDLDYPGVFHCGDVMYDNKLFFSDKLDDEVILKKLGLEKGFFLTTTHRIANTNNPDRLSSIFEALFEISEEKQRSLVLPLHPRTKKMMEVNLSFDLQAKIKESEYLKLIDPVSYLEMMVLLKNCALILTDSGGLQKEAFFFQKPCVVMRPETEWVELVENGNVVLVSSNKEQIINEAERMLNLDGLTYPPFYGDGKAAQFIIEKMIKYLPH